MSTNLEANYVLPSLSTDFTQGLYEKILFVDGVEDQNADDAGDGASEDLARKLESLTLFSRKNVYRMIEQKMEDYGVDGHACLLRMICEVGESNFHEPNGVVGSLFNILMS